MDLLFILFSTVHQLKQNTNSKTSLQCFEPKLDYSLLGIDYQVLWPVSINYPDFTTVYFVPLCKVCRVITGRTCLKLLFSRWQAGKTQELVSTMCSRWSLYSKHLAFRWHGAAIGLAELKWVMVKVLLAEEEKLRIPRTQKANFLYFRGKHSIQTRADQTQSLIAGGPVSCSQWEEMWGLKGLNLDWMWRSYEFQSLKLQERERVKGQQTGFGGLWSCIR